MRFLWDLLLAGLVLAAPVNVIADEIASSAIVQQTLEMRQSHEAQGHGVGDKDPVLKDQADRFDQYQRQVEKRLAEQQKRIDELQALLQQALSSGNIETQKKDAAVSSPDRMNSIKSLLEQRAAGADPSAAADNPDVTPQRVGIPPSPTEKEQFPEVAQIFDQPGVLTPRGRLVFEPSIQYSHSTTNRIALVGYTIIPAITIGLIDVREVTRNNYVAALAMRYGLTNRLEVEARLPYIYRTESTLSREANIEPGSFTDTIFSSRNGHIGDLDFGLRYQVNQPVNDFILVAGLKGLAPTGTGPFDVPIDDKTGLPTKLATGSGFWGVQGSLSLLYVSDPAVMFGGVNYLWNIERNVGRAQGKDWGRVDPGDSYGINFGMGIALNEKSSLSIGYEHSLVGVTKIGGKRLPTARSIQVGSLLIGSSVRFTPRMSVNLSLGVGVTEGSPDVQLTLKVPFTI